MDQFERYHNVIEKSVFVNSDTLEVRFKKLLLRYLEIWKKEVIANLERVASVKQGTEKALGATPPNLNPDDIAAIAKFSPGNFIQRAVTLALAAAQKGLERSYKDMGIILAWDIDMSPIADFYVNHYQTWFSEFLGQEKQMDIIHTIGEGVKNGETIENLKNRISDEFNGPVHVPAKKDENGEVTRKEYQIDKDVYSEMVARTEVSKAVNAGRIHGYEQSGIAKTVKWHTNPGACELCIPHEGEVFDVGESLDILPYHPNCRCTWLVDEYRQFDEELSPNKFANPGEIYSDPDGVGIMDLMKLPTSVRLHVDDLLARDKVEEASKLIKENI